MSSPASEASAKAETHALVASASRPFLRSTSPSTTLAGAWIVTSWLASGSARAASAGSISKMADSSAARLTLQGQQLGRRQHRRTQLGGSSQETGSGVVVVTGHRGARQPAVGNGADLADTPGRRTSRQGHLLGKLDGPVGVGSDDLVGIGAHGGITAGPECGAGVQEGTFPLGYGGVGNVAG